MKKQNDDIPRSIQLSDFILIFTGFFHNLVSAVHTLTDELLEIATYNAIRDSQVKRVWQDFTEDLEKMEDGNG